MSGRRCFAVRAVWAVSCALLVALVVRDARAQPLITFEAPHAVRAPAATLAPGFESRVDARAVAANMKSASDIVAFTLRETAAQLHFGLAHRTSLQFDGTEREGNCIEYAELFATMFNREHGVIDAHAWVVRSDAKVLGQTLADPAWKDHDWVLVVANDHGAIQRLFVDPTRSDTGIGWDISQSVRGHVGTPVASSFTTSVTVDARLPETPSLSGFEAAAPVRLSLQGAILPMSSSFPNCASREDPAGNSVGGIPISHYEELQVTPHLVLSGFSRQGCPIDASIGGSLTFAAPIRDSVWLVVGAGIIVAPGQLPIYGGVQTSGANAIQGTDSAVHVAAHADIVWKTQSGRSFSVGAGALRRRRGGLTFGGGF
jgi:hypothetical protein